MSASSSLADDLAATGLLAHDEAESPAASSGFQHRHGVTPEAMPTLAEIYARHDYYLEMLACLDERQTANRMRLVYTFNRFGPADRHLYHVELAPTRPWSGPKAAEQAAPAHEAPSSAASAPLPTQGRSIAHVFAAANWFEREVYDMHGVGFNGHPGLRRILLPDDADFHPLLKDFGRIEDAPKAGDDANA